MSDMFFPKPCSLAIAVGAAAGLSKLDLQLTLNAYLHSFITNQVQAAIRLSIIGQTAAARLLSKLEPEIQCVTKAASTGSLDDLGSATIMADIMAMKHEQLSGRLFRSCQNQLTAPYVSA